MNEPQTPTILDNIRGIGNLCKSSVPLLVNFSAMMSVGDISVIDAIVKSDFLKSLKTIELDLLLMRDAINQLETTVVERHIRDSMRTQRD